MKLFINTSADPLDSLVQSLTDNSSSELQNLFLGDSLPLRITFTDGSGGYSSWNGETGLSVKVAIGLLATNQTFILEESFIYQYNGYKGNLTLATETLASALDNLDSLDLTFEIQVARNNGETITTLQIPCNVQNQLITTGLVPVDFDLDGYLSNVDPNDFDSNITPLDRDGDGVVNENDSFPDDANETTDSDLDGVGDNSDYFPFNGSISLSQSVLDSYVEDIYKSPSEGDIIKIKQEYTHTKSDGTSNLFSVGEYFLIQEVTSTNNIKILVSGVAFYLPFLTRTEKWEIVNSLSNLAPDPNLDTDGDFKIDSEDYFLNDSNYTQSKEDLDGYSFDTYKAPAIGDIIKIKETLVINSISLEQGSYHIVTNINEGQNVKIVFDGNNLYPNFNSRGTQWEIVNPSDILTADPNLDTDGDSKIDTEDYFSNDVNYTQSKSDLDGYSLDPFRTPITGDIVKVLDTFNGNSTDGNSTNEFILNEYYLISYVGGSTIRLEYDSVSYIVNIGSRNTKWEIVNPSDQLTPDNTPTTDFTSGGFTGLFENGKYGYQQGDYDFYNKYAFNGSTYFEVGLGVGTFKDNSTGFEEVVFTNLHEGGAGTYNLVLANGWSISNVYLDNFGQNDPNRSTISAFDLTKTS